MRTAPAMANPFEYRETLWTILYKGEEPTPKAPELPAAPRRRGAKPEQPKPARRFTRTEALRLEDFNAEIIALQERRKAQSDDD